MKGVSVNITLTINASVHRTTSANETGYYSYSEVESGEYYVNCSKLRYWQNSSMITIGAGETGTLNITIWLKGDLKDNGIAADAVDLGMMKTASVGTLIADWRYDLNINGFLADSDVDDEGSDLALMKKASAGAIELV